MAATDRFEGTVSELARNGAGQDVVLTFWLVADNGNRALVESRQDRPLHDGDRVEVVGERDSQGTLAAADIRNLKTAPVPGAQPLQWGRVFLCSLLAAVICSALALALGSSILKNATWGSLIAYIIFVPLAYFALSFVCSIVLTGVLTSYRRGKHALIAALISLPISWAFLLLAEKALLR